MNFGTTLKTLAVLLILGIIAGAAFADDDESAKDKKKMDGKELFKNHCKVCHMEDSKAGEYTPMSLIMDQWDEFFDDVYPETHQDLACPTDEEKKLSDVLDKNMIKKIRKFCVDHAADSEQPMTCG